MVILIQALSIVSNKEMTVITWEPANHLDTGAIYSVYSSQHLRNCILSQVLLLGRWAGLWLPCICDNGENLMCINLKIVIKNLLWNEVVYIMVQHCFDYMGIAKF